jgi:predicted nucleic acid-binding Zn ribbon protein
VLESPTVERAGEFLGRVAQRLGKPEAAIAWLGAAWPSIVGGALAAHTRPIRCESGCLTIAADGKPWQRQLEGLKPEFCNGINRAWGRTLVREVKFIAGKSELNSVSRELDNGYTPFIRKRS